MEHSTLNRLVVGSIPTASTTIPHIINAFSTTKRARKDIRRSCVVVFVGRYLSSLVILWSYLGIQSQETVPPKVVWACVKGVIPLLSPHMNFLGFALVSRYLRLAYLRMENLHETLRNRCLRYSHGTRCPGRSRPRRSHPLLWQSHPALPARQPGLRPQLAPQLTGTAGGSR